MLSGHLRAAAGRGHCVVAVQSAGRRGREPVHDVVGQTSARWRRRALGHQLQILQSIIHRDAVAVNDLKARRDPAAMSLPASTERNEI